MLSKILLSFFLNILIVFIQAIDLKPIRVPSIVTEGSSIYLECKFDLEGFQLYAVKWRKNRGLFYKYQLDDIHGIKRSYPMAGVNVNLKFSNETHVFLENVDFNTQGTYSCDVISKDPFQKEVSSEDQLTVVHSDFLLSPLISKGPRFQKQVQFSNQGSAIIAPETQKEKTTTTTLKKSATYISHNHNGAALNHDQLDNLHHRLSSTIDLSKIKNLNYNQHQDYYVDKNAHLHIDQTANKKIKTVESEYFPVEFGPTKVHTDIKPHEHKVTTITKTFINSPKVKNDDNVLSQKIKLLEHLHLDHPHNLDDKQKSARIEVEEDVVPDHHHHYNYPHDHKLQGGVYKLTPEQYNDLKFLSRDTGDVVLFKPVSNHSLSSFSLRCQSSYIISNFSIIFLILMFNLSFVKF